MFLRGERSIPTGRCSKSRKGLNPTRMKIFDRLPITEKRTSLRFGDKYVTLMFPMWPSGTMITSVRLSTVNSAGTPKSHQRLDTSR